MKPLTAVAHFFIERHPPGRCQYSQNAGDPSRRQRKSTAKNFQPWLGALRQQCCHIAGNYRVTSVPLGGKTGGPRRMDFFVRYWKWQMTGHARTRSGHPSIFSKYLLKMDARAQASGSDAVLRTAMPAHDERRQNQRSLTRTVSPGFSCVPSGTMKRPVPEASLWVRVTLSRLARGENPPAIATALSTLILGT
jgi:hypothetical protein